MAYTVLQQPVTNQLNSVQYPVFFRLEDTAYADPKYRYVAEVTISGVVRGVLKVPPATYGGAVIDVSRICQDYLEFALKIGSDISTNYNQAPHAQGSGSSNQLASFCDEPFVPIRQVTVRVGYSKATSATTAPTITYVSTHIFPVGLWAGDAADRRDPTLAQIQTDLLSSFAPTASGKRLLTECPEQTGLDSSAVAGTTYYVNDVTLDSWACLQAWYAANTGGNRDLLSDWRYLLVKYKKTDTGTFGTIALDIELALGTAATAIDEDREMLVTLGVGPKNWLARTGYNALKNELSNDNVDYYDLWLSDTSITYPPTSGRTRFVVKGNDCYNGSPVRLGWVNRTGGWDYYNFTKKRVKSVRSTKENFNQDSGNWNDDAPFVGWRSYQGGQTTFKADSMTSIEMSTDWIPERDNALIESLLVSPLVHRVDNYQSASLGVRFQNVQIIESRFTEKTQRNDKLIRYTFTVESAKQNKVV